MTTRLELGVLRPVDGGYVGALARNPAGDDLVIVAIRRRSPGGKPAQFDVLRTGELPAFREIVEVIGWAWERAAGELIISLFEGLAERIPLHLVTMPGEGVELVVVTAQLDLLDRI